MNRLLTTSLVAGMLASSLFQSAQAATPTVKLKVLYSSGKVAPGSDRPLAELSAPSVSGSNVAFLGKSSPLIRTTPVGDDFPNAKTKETTQAVYALFSGRLSLVKAYASTELISGFRPGVRTSGLSAPALQGSTIAFSSFELGDQVLTGQVERYSNGNLQTIAPVCRKVARSSFFYTIEQPVALDNDAVAWVGDASGCPIVGNSPPDSAIVRSRQGKLDVLVDYKTKLGNGTLIPNGLFRDPILKGDKVQFAYGGGGSASMLYSARNGQARAIYGENTAIPNVSLNPKVHCGSDFLSNRTVFCLTGDGRGQGLYQQWGKAAITPIVTSNTSVPGENRKFSGLASPRLSGENLFFVEQLPSQPSVGLFNEIVYPVKGIYVRKRTGIVKVFAVGGAIGGKEAVGLSIGANPISGNRVVFAVKFKDGSTSVVQADL